MSKIPVRRLDFTDVALYAITPEPTDSKKLLEQIDGLLQGGVDAVQLRARSLADRDFVALGKEIKQRCEKAGAFFLVNNRVDLALAIDADGLHIGHEDLPIAFVRNLLGHRKIIGMSTHALPEAIDAQRKGADYVSCGPLWTTPTKPGRKAVGINLIGFYKAAIRVPFVAIGGVDANNLDEVLENGAKTVGIVRALFDSSEPAKTAADFKSKILKKWDSSPLSFVEMG